MIKAAAVPRYRLLCFGIFCCASAACATQACKAPNPNQAISTDRPTSTNASTTVPCRTLQFENGLNETAAGGQRGWDLPETSVRFGALTRTELRFTAPDYFWNTQISTAFATEVGDLDVGVKQQLGPVHGVDVAAAATLSLPAGRSLSPATATMRPCS